MISLLNNKPLFTLYTTQWCGDCFRLKLFLKELHLEAGKHYTEIDIDQNPEAAQVVEQINSGHRSVPTILFRDNTTLTEPSNGEFKEKISGFLPPMSSEI